MFPLPITTNTPATLAPAPPQGTTFTPWTPTQRDQAQRLATAIRAGAMIRPQAYRGYFTCEDGDTPHSCALGAAYETLTGTVDRSSMAGVTISHFLSRAYPILGVNVILSLGTPRAEGILSLRGAIAHLNDRARWSREQIADWLDQLGQ